MLSLKNYKSGFRTDLVDFTTRELGALMKRNASTISRWLKQLAAAKHIEKISGHGERAVFRLMSPVYHAATRVQVGPKITVEVKGGELHEVRNRKSSCPKCGKLARITSSSGVCSQCLADWVNRTA